MGAAASTEPPDESPPVDLLGVLDAIAHGEHVQALHRFVTQHCEIFPLSMEDEQPLVCTEVHRQYVELFERSLTAAVHADGRIAEGHFVDAMQRAVRASEEAEYTEVAEHIMSHVAAAENYGAFAALCRCLSSQRPKRRSSSVESFPLCLAHGH